MKLIVLVYRIDQEEYPVLSHQDDNQIEHWINDGGLELGNVYDKLPGNEVYINHPVSVTIVDE